MSEVKWMDSNLKPFKIMEPNISVHKHSKSDPTREKVEEVKTNNIFEAYGRFKLEEMGHLKKSAQAKKMQSFKTHDVRSSLTQEITQLQERLNNQLTARRAMEKALRYRPISRCTTNENLIPKTAKELIKEVAMLELEVVYLEQYLLSLYRKTHNQKIPSSIHNNTNEEFVSNSTKFKKPSFDILDHDIVSLQENSVISQSRFPSSRTSVGSTTFKERDDISREDNILDSGIYRTHSTLSHRSEYSFRMSPSSKTISNAMDSFHSLPLSMFEKTQHELSKGVSLGTHFKTCFSDRVSETPNWLSEEIIKCISSIYTEIADPPLPTNQNISFSPFFYTSSINTDSSRHHDDIWGPHDENISSSNPQFEKHLHDERSNGPYSAMTRVQSLHRDNHKLKDIECKLEQYRSLVYRLEDVNPRKLTHEEKLAFWINVHNALVMHAYLVYGIPKSNLKRISSILKAAYNVGGQTVTVDMIQTSILGFRTPRPGQWLSFLFHSKKKFKVGDPRKHYAIGKTTPFLHFALCSGSYSDPAVRVYTANRVFLELEVAKEEFIESNITLTKEGKVFLPKTIDSYAKDYDLCMIGLVKSIEHLFPKNVEGYKYKKLAKSIEWIPHNFEFGYLLSKDLT